MCTRENDFSLYVDAYGECGLANRPLAHSAFLQRFSQMRDWAFLQQSTRIYLCTNTTKESYTDNAH